MAAMRLMSLSDIQDRSMGNFMISFKFDATFCMQISCENQGVYFLNASNSGGKVIKLVVVIVGSSKSGSSCSSSSSSSSYTICRNSDVVVVVVVVVILERVVERVIALQRIQIYYAYNMNHLN